MSTVQPTPPLPDADELLERYHEAVALDAAAPDANLRAAVLAQAEVTAWRHAATAADDEDADALATDELPARAEPAGGEAEFSSELPLPAGAAAEAANERQWFIPVAASVAVLGLATLLALQFDRSGPAEQAVALGQRSAAPADAVPAAPTSAPAASAAIAESASEVAEPEATEPEISALEAAKPEASTPDAAAPEPAAEPAPEPEPPAPPPPVTEPSPAAVVPEPTPAAAPSAAPAAREPSPAAVAPKPTRAAAPARPRTQAPRKPEQPAARAPARTQREAARTERRPAPPPRAAAQRPGAPAAAPAALPDSAPATDATPLPPESTPAADAQLTPSTPAATRRPGPGGEFAAPELGYEHDRVPLPTASPRPFPASPGLDGTTAEPGTHSADQPATLTPSQRLLAAAAQGQVAAARNALQQGAAANASDGRGQTALMLAARRGDVAMARLLLASGADARRADRQGLSAIEHARRAGHEALARHLEQGTRSTPATQ